ncbi:MAG: tetratricopeptide repeat protein [Bdellovibrionaceae bacterium]|nr:tetratricopeptide repeat protein [Pseudobdellovibrionaceae bacterium]
MIYFRIGEIKLKNREYEDAANAFSKVTFGSSYNNQALYNRAMANLENNKIDNAIALFQQMIDHRSKSSVTDTNKVAAQMGLARSYYQKQEWDTAIDIYSQIPRDHFLWHDALFEQSWAMLRGARFRSALSNFQSLHSSYYEDFYIPESLLLRAIVYLYICKYDEMEKVLSLFEKTYEPVKIKIGSFLGNSSESMSYYQELEKKLSVKRQEDLLVGLKLPYMVLKNIAEEGDVRRSLSYLRRIQEEKNAIENSGGFRSSGLGQYSVRVLNTRIKNTKVLIGDMVKAHLQNMKDELQDLFEQASFIRYEMINGKKETLRKKIAGRDLPNTIDNQIDREFYIENGFEFYPFKGEFWLDEIGNYHYLGKQSCE